MTYEVRLARRAAAYISRLDRPTAERIIRRLDEIASDPFGPHQTPHQCGRETIFTRWRLPDHFSVDTDEDIIDVSAVAPRGRAYRDV